MALSIDDLLRRAVENKSSDLHLKVGNHPYLRVDGLLQGFRVQLRPGQSPARGVTEVVPDAEAGHAVTSIRTLTSPLPRVMSWSKPWETAASSGTTELITRSTGNRPVATMPAIRGKSCTG